MRNNIERSRTNNMAVLHRNANCCIIHIKKDRWIMKFQVGDIVEWCGVRGTVKELNEYITDVCMKVEFKGFSYPFESVVKHKMFTVDGKLEIWHTEPSLVLIERIHEGSTNGNLMDMEPKHDPKNYTLKLPPKFDHVDIEEREKMVDETKLDIAARYLSDSWEDLDDSFQRTRSIISSQWIPRKNTRTFKEFITKDGFIPDNVCTDEGLTPFNELHNGFKYFLQWTGREFEIEVDW